MTGENEAAAAPAPTAQQIDFMRRKQRFALTLAVVVFAFFLPLPILGGFTPVLDAPVIGGVTLAWLYAFAQFVLAIVAAAIYMRRAAEFDSEAQALVVTAPSSADHEGEAR